LIHGYVAALRIRGELMLSRGLIVAMMDIGRIGNAFPDEAFRDYSEEDLYV
jgi:hypothetical protein